MRMYVWRACVYENACVCTRTHIYIYIYIYIAYNCAHIEIYIEINACVYAHTQTHTHVHIHTYVCVYDMHTYISMYMCIYICVCAHMPGQTNYISMRCAQTRHGPSWDFGCGNANGSFVLAFVGCDGWNSSVVFMDHFPEGEHSLVGVHRPTLLTNSTTTALLMCKYKDL